MGSTSKGAALQWSLWCRSKDYFGKHLGAGRLARMASLRQRWWTIGFTDDPIANWQTIPHMMRFYPGARFQFDMITPAELGLKEVGHHGFFRPGCELLWERLVVFYENAGKSESRDAGEA